MLAFDPIGQGERYQYADIPEGRADPEHPWSQPAPGTWLWTSVLQHARGQGCRTRARGVGGTRAVG